MYLDYYTSSEFIEEVRNKVLESLLATVNNQNQMKLDKETTNLEFEQYKRNNGFKAFIERGNHGSIVKTVLNRRSWWSIQETHEENFETTDFIWTQWIKQPIVDSFPTEATSSPSIRTYGKLEENFNLSNKNSLTKNLTEYYKTQGEDDSDSLPLTFLVQGGSEDQSFEDFRQYFIMMDCLEDEDNKWI